MAEIIGAADAELRVATFNASLNRNSAGALITDLSTLDDTQAQSVAEIIQRTNPDVILINEFDYDAAGTAADLFRQNYLEVSQNGVDPIEYPYVYLAPSNTGIPSGFDLDNSGTVGGAGDTFGFGFFEGQFGMVVFSKYPILTDEVRTFQTFLWKDMPGNLLTEDPTEGTDNLNNYYSPEEIEVLRLSSKSHWDVPVEVNGEVVHILAAHPTPPVFDGSEDRNGKRNFDEIRFWTDYVTPGAGDYIYDDNGGTGGLAAGQSFVIVGDYNADPFDGDAYTTPAGLGAANQFFNTPAIQGSLFNRSFTPSSEGGPDATERQAGFNTTHQGDPALDTADFGFNASDPNSDLSPGNLRVDYALPSQNFEIVDSQVFWQASTDPLFPLAEFPTSDHRLVYVDLAFGSSQNRVTVTGVEAIGEVNFATGFTFEETQVGGLSGISYDAASGLYYSLSDDRSQLNPARFYTLTIDLSDGSLDDGDVVFTDVTTLLDENDTPFAINSLDPEGIALTRGGTVFVTSEGDANALINPFVNEFSLTGEQLNTLPVDTKFLPTADQSGGIRNNLAFESATITPDGRYLYTATENALYQDGSASTVDDTSYSRIIKYDLATGKVVAEYVYEVEPVAEAPNPADGFATNGLVELLAIDNNGTLLALERSFSVGNDENGNPIGNTVKLYEVLTQGALNVKDFDDLYWEAEDTRFDIDPFVIKRELVDFEADFGITPDNLEGLALGPVLADGRQSLIVVSDNNFSATQTTQFVALALDTKVTPAVLPTLETPYTVDDENGLFEPELVLRGDSDDPAIWVHPTDPSQSIVLGTLKDGGLAVFNLAGELLQTITSTDINPDLEYGEIRYNNVDLLYGFQLNGESVDLAVASDRYNDTLAVFKINPDFANSTPLEVVPLTDLTDSVDPSNTSSTIFNINDPGEATAYGLATYTSPISGESYAFVTQADGAQVAQLQLIDNGDGSVSADLVRMLTVPVPTGDPSDSQTEGIVVDQELGLVYVATEADEEGFGIFRFSAEPNGGDTRTLIQPIGQPQLVPDLEGLNIYYGANGTGYLIANSQGDSSYAVYRREGNNEYLGSFIIGDNRSLGIDQVNESDGLDIINVALGDAFPNGLAVFQDGANDPQNAVENDDEVENNATNFKFVDWAAIANSFDIPLTIDTNSFDPRNPGVYSLVNGVASGDVDQDSAVLWARSTFVGIVTFEYSADASFGTIAGTATATVTNPNVPVKVSIEGLDSNTEYFYRVTDAAGATESGRFVTAAALGEQVGLTFGVTGDWRGEVSPYPAIANVAERNLDFFVALGDTIYADDTSPAVLNPDGSQKAQAETLDEYRTKHNEVYSDRFGANFWREVRASTSILSSIDDHEVTNDFQGGADASTDDRFAETSGFINDTELFENGLQVYQEYNPLRDEFYTGTGSDLFEGERKLYRYNTYGSDAAVITLDTRSFRSQNLPTPNPTDLDAVATAYATSLLTPDRTLLGDIQLEQLKADLVAADEAGITWKFVMIPEPIQNILVGVNMDAYEGFAQERAALLQFIDESNIQNVVFVSADIHITTVNNLTYQTGDLTSDQIATSIFEITTGSVAYDAPSGNIFAQGIAALSPDPVAALTAYNSLPIAPDSDDLVNDKDDFVKTGLNSVYAQFPQPFDPIGLNNNLPQADGLIDAELLQGDYFVSHSYSWTEFDIDQATQVLTVTTYGIDGYTEEEVLADPEGILSREPQILSQFVVNPNVAPELVSQSFTLAENSVIGTVVGTIAATDANTGHTDALVYSIDDPTGRFVVDAATGVITLADATGLDFEGDETEFTFAATVTDPTRLSTSAPITVSLTDVPDSVPSDDFGFDPDEPGSAGFFRANTELTLKISIQTNTSVRTASELVIFSVDGADGNVDGNSPNSDATAYLNAILDGEKLLGTMSLLPGEEFNPSGLGDFADIIDDFEQLIDLAAGQRIGFLLVENGSLGDSDASIFYSNQSSFGFSAFSSTSFSLSFSGSSTSFDLNLQADPPGLGKKRFGLQTGREYLECLDRRGEDALTGNSVRVYSEAAFDNLVGFYLTDIDGRVLNINGDVEAEVGADNYFTELVANRLNISLSANTTTTIDFVGDAIITPFLVSNGTFENFQNIFTPFYSTDNFDHFRLLGSGTFAVEDQVGGGDQDFDDMIIQVTFA